MNESPEQFGAWPSEHEAMHYAAYTAGLAIEIGCFQGWTSRYLARYCGELICIDPWDGEQDGSDERIYQAFLKNTAEFDNITVIRAKSQDAKVDQYKGKVDLIFVDGLHTYDGCITDLRKFEPLLSDTGTIFVHDAFDGGWPGVRKAVFDYLWESGRTAQFSCYFPTPDEQHIFQHGISGLAYWTK